jgi:hypothetical protein
MSLKTATLIALIGIALELCINITWIFPTLFRIIHRSRILSISNAMILPGSLILFLDVFYAKQKE